MKKLILFFLHSIIIIEINCQGRLLVPPARSSAWREDPIRFPVNYDDNLMSCGGFDQLWNVNDGKCGICGEDYSLIPKEYEYNGTKYRNITVRKYSKSDQINVVVEVKILYYNDI
jgi:hypothetical protein